VFLVQGGRAVDEKGVWEEWRSEAAEVMGVWMDLDGKQWRGSERAWWVRRGTRRVLALKAPSVS
jgi:hypothetical protein